MEVKNKCSIPEFDYKKEYLFNKGDNIVSASIQNKIVVFSKIYYNVKRMEKETKLENAKKQAIFDKIVEETKKKVEEECKKEKEQEKEQDMEEDAEEQEEEQEEEEEEVLVPVFETCTYKMNDNEIINHKLKKKTEQKKEIMVSFRITPYILDNFSLTRAQLVIYRNQHGIFRDLCKTFYLTYKFKTSQKFTLFDEHSSKLVDLTIYSRG